MILNTDNEEQIFVIWANTKASVGELIATSLEGFVLLGQRVIDVEFDT